MGIEINIPGIFAGPLYPVDFRPGRTCILAASLTMRRGTSKSVPLEAAFVKYGAHEPTIQGTLPGMRVTSGGRHDIEIPGFLTTGTDLAAPWTPPPGAVISVVAAKLDEAPTGADVIIEIQIDAAQWTVYFFREDGAPNGAATARFPAGSTLPLVNDSGLAAYKGLGAFVSGAQGPVVGGKEVRVKVNQVGSATPGKGLKVSFFY